MTEEELEKSFLKVQETKKYFVNYMQDNLTPSEAVAVVTGLLMTMYDALTDNPTVEGFIGTFGGIYKVHHAMHNGDMHQSTQTLQ